MTYGWREPDGAPLGGVELCDQCGFDARAVTDEPGELDHAFAQLARLLEHPDRARRPQPEIFSAEEYVGHCVEVTRLLLGLITDVTGIGPEDEIVDLPSARAASARVLPALTGAHRDARHTGTYSHDVSAGWIARHLAHDLAHHVLDIRCGYAKLALAELPGEWNAGRGPGVQHDGIRQASLGDSTALGRLFDALGYPADETAIRRRLSRLGLATIGKVPTHFMSAPATHGQEPVSASCSARSDLKVARSDDLAQRPVSRPLRQDPQRATASRP